MSDIPTRSKADRAGPNMASGSLSLVVPSEQAAAHSAHPGEELRSQHPYTTRALSGDGICGAPVRVKWIRFDHKVVRQRQNLRRFPVISDHSAVRYDRKTPSDTQAMRPHQCAART